MATKTYSIYLVKEEVTKFENVFKDGILKEDTFQAKPQGEFGEGAKLFIFQGMQKPPTWLSDVKLVFSNGLADLRLFNKPSCAVIVFKKAGRLFIVTFGYGWQYINDIKIETDFGLMVAVNSLDDTKLNRIDTSHLGEAMKGISHSPSQRDLQAFGVDDVLSLLSRITGKGEDDTFASNISGATALRISKEMTLADLPSVAEEALELYQAVDYKDTAFSIIDKVKPIRDKALQNKLDEIAVDKIIQGEDNFELSMPGWYEEDVVYYRFVGFGKSDRLPNLLLSDYREAFGNNLASLNTQTISKHCIMAEFSNDTARKESWSIKKALIGSVVLNDAAGDRLYAINEGQWYRLDQQFKKSVDAILSTVVEEWDIVPLVIMKKVDNTGKKTGFESELDYNKRCAKAYNQICMDQEIFIIQTILPGKGKFEACDILDIENKKLIHVKKSSRKSSLLSHFFKQGSNSAQILKMYSEVRKMLIERVTEISGDAIGEKLKTALGESMAGWTVEFHIIDTPRKDGKFQIPFFSRITLRDEKMRLNGMEFKVAVKFIPIAP